MERRDWLKTALVGTGAAAAGPLVTTIAPAPGAAAQATTETPWQPMLFDEHQNETVVVLSELIIPTTDTPGGKAAKVNEYIDLMLHDVDPDHGHAFLKGLGWLDGHAMGLHGSPFVALDEAQQVEILKSLDGSSDPELATGAKFFAKVKRMTVEGYYTSRIGIAELNKHGVPASFGCDHDDQA